MMFPERIKYLRQTQGLNQVQLADKLGTTKQSISNWENDNIVPSVDMLEKIADFFNMPIDFFFNREIDISNLNIGHQVKGNGNNVSGDITLSEYQKEIAHLKELLAEKERTIQILMNK